MIKGIFRGIVVDNKGDSGLCKVFIHGVHPEEYFKFPDNLPWAEPAMSLFGGNYVNDDTTDLNNNTGICAWAKLGAIVWTFFEAGDQNKPVYFAYCQGGNDWFSEHNKQYVFKNDNITIRIDDEPTREESTSKFDSYNTNNNSSSTPLAKTDIPTTLDIDVRGNVNIRINGSVNMKIEGDIYKEHVGDLHETHIGNHYIQHTGDTHKVQIGDRLFEQTGNETYQLTGNQVETITENRTVNVNNNDSLTVQNISTHTNNTIINETYRQKNTTTTTNESKTVGGNYSNNVKGQSNNTITGSLNTTVAGSNIEKVGRSKIVTASEYIEKARAIKMN